MLVDNNTLSGLRGEWGLSLFIEDNNKNILLDVGSSDLFIENAKAMDIELLKLDYLVLSHGHHDHTWGLPYLIRHYKMKGLQKEDAPETIAHPFAFYPRISPKGKKFDPMVSDKELGIHFNLQLSKEPKWLTERLVYLGEIPRNNDFESKESMVQVVTPEGVIDDYTLDDTALAYKGKEGLVIITGCSHSGICNIVEYAKKVCGDERIYDIVGGFHLMNSEEHIIKETAKYMENNTPEVLHPCHCTGLKAKIELSKVANVQHIGVGMELEYE